MSTRPSQVAPEELTTEQQCAVKDAVGAARHLAGALLPALHGVQDKLGYVPDAAIPLIADALNLSRAEVHGVVSFYHHFRTRPAGRHILSICRAEACQASGGSAIERQLQLRLGIDYGETSADGGVSLEAVYCFGSCAASPAMMLDGELLGRVSLQHVHGLLERVGIHDLDVADQRPGFDSIHEVAASEPRAGIHEIDTGESRAGFDEVAAPEPRAGFDEVAAREPRAGLDEVDTGESRASFDEVAAREPRAGIREGAPEPRVDRHEGDAFNDRSEHPQREGSEPTRGNKA